MLIKRVIAGSNNNGAPSPSRCSLLLYFCQWSDADEFLDVDIVGQASNEIEFDKERIRGSGVSGVGCPNCKSISYGKIRSKCRMKAIKICNKMFGRDTKWLKRLAKNTKKNRKRTLASTEVQAPASVHNNFPSDPIFFALMCVCGAFGETKAVENSNNRPIVRAPRTIPL